MLQIDLWILFSNQLFQFTNRGSFNSLAGDRTLEHIMGLVLRINRQFRVKSSGDMNVRKNTSLIVLDDLLALDIEHVPLLFQQVRKQANAVAKDVKVDVRAFADMACHDTSD